MEYWSVGVVEREGVTEYWSDGSIGAAGGFVDDPRFGPRRGVLSLHYSTTPTLHYSSEVG